MQLHTHTHNIRRNWRNLLRGAQARRKQNTNQQQGEWQADDVAAPHDDCMLARNGHTTSFQQLNATQRGARRIGRLTLWVRKNNKTLEHPSDHATVSGKLGCINAVSPHQLKTRHGIAASLHQAATSFPCWRGGSRQLADTPNSSFVLLITDKTTSARQKAHIPTRTVFCNGDASQNCLLRHVFWQWELD